MNTHSLWKNLNSKETSKISQNLDTEVLIIGGGITGLQVLYQLKKEGTDALLVERNLCGEGVTSKSTAKITYLQNDTIDKIANLVKEEKAKEYILSQIYATKLLRDIIESESIDCDLAKADSYLFADTKKGVHRLNYLAELLKECHITYEELKTVPFEKSVKKAIKVRDTYVFHPIKFTDALKEKFRDSIYENSKVEKIEKQGNYYISHVGNYQIKSHYVVLATHYPYFLFPYMLPLKTHIEVSYLGAKKVLEKENYSAINMDSKTISLRYHSDGKDNYLIYLLNSFKSPDVKDITANFKELKERDDFDYLWSNNDIITNDHMPLIGPLSKKEDKFLIATGYNTWGMTNSTLAGKIIKDMIVGNRDAMTNLFLPYRKLNLAKLVRFPLDMSCNLKSYLISNGQNRNNSSVSYTKIDGQNVAIYRDSDGVEHVVLNRCPHMKCGLILNEEEGTWDCLCHGSRYTLDGKCIEGPSNLDISFKR